MAFTFQNTVSVEDYMALRAAVEWVELIPEQAQNGLEHTTHIVSCYDDERIVGMARVVWDGGYIAYMSDVMIMPEYQGKGIGRQLVGRIIDFVKSQLREGWKIKIVLISAKGKEGFYKKFGFQEKPCADSGPGMDMWLTK